MKKEDIILEFIKEYAEEHGYSPSIRDIVAGCGISSTSVVEYHLVKLEDKNMISRDRYKATFKTHESGIRRVVEAYVKYLPSHDIRVVAPKESADVIAVHAGTAPGADVAHCHGLYWTADYKAPLWEWKANRNVLTSAIKAKYITVPTTWVQETFQRDMRVSPQVVGHGIEADQWQDLGNSGYILWNKI